MKYIKKIPVADKETKRILMAEGWIKLKEPTNLKIATLLSIPFMIINTIIFIGITIVIYPLSEEFLNIISDFKITLNINFTVIVYISSIILFTIIHEFIHACFIPNFLKSNKTYWGINRGFGFVYTTEKIKRWRYIIISIMPFIILSIIFPILVNRLGILNKFILFLCLVNAMGSSVDSLNIWIILRRVPKGATIINNGFETYYRK
ncbi:DUF3267 domain-containing protein [uncultured Clostridium sp.]|uniref:DUF3267 domain-containing protein n=1 Tax=uncultured Clostridium sp. TaxID=59620 RepID=UPI002606B4C3|nr:DUF3267 domain-containing protein [uncultured Clostridium sp.]